MAMSKVVRCSVDAILPFVLVFGAYIVLHGHLTPGGGFQGGAVMATAAALVLVARSRADASRRVPKGGLQLIEAAGLVLFVGAGLSALLVSSPFLYNWIANAGGAFGEVVAPGANPGELNSAGLIPVMNVAVGLEVVGALAAILSYMLAAGDPAAAADGDGAAEEAP